jgi:hypothetical protein
MTPEEDALWRLLYDTLLGSSPIIGANVREALSDLLSLLGHEELAGKALTM